MIFVVTEIQLISEYICHTWRSNQTRVTEVQSLRPLHNKPFLNFAVQESNVLNFRSFWALSPRIAEIFSYLYGGFLPITKVFHVFN